MKRLCLLAIALALPASASAAGSSSLTAHTWLLASLGGKAPVAHTAVTMKFAGGRVSGSAGCNDYSASYDAGRRTLKIGKPVASTLKACSSAVNAQEKSFLAMLSSVKRYSAGSTLTLRGTLGKELAKFGAESQDLAGTTWKVIAYNNGKGAVTSVSSGTRVNAAFAKGHVFGSGGCNEYSATYTATTPKITIGPVSATMKACTTPANVMTQEAAFFAALGTAKTYKIEGGRLELRTSSGALAVDLARS